MSATHEELTPKQSALKLYEDYLRKRVGVNEAIANPFATQRILYNGSTMLHLLANRISLGDDDGELKLFLAHPEVATVKNEDGSTPLHWLATRGVEDALSHPGFATAKDSWGSTPLHKMAECGHQKVLSHPDVAVVRDKHGITPLHELARSECVAVLSHPEVATVATNDGITPLHVLALRGIEEVAAALKNPKSATIADSRGRTPLHCAAKSRVYKSISHPDFATLRDNEGNTPLHYLAMERTDNGKSNSNDHFYMCIVLEHPKAAIVRNHNDKTPIHFIAERGNPKAKKLVVALDEEIAFERKLMNLSKRALEERVKTNGCKSSQRVLEDMYGQTPPKSSPVNEEIER